jgi:uncharacterized membrane protein
MKFISDPLYVITILLALIVFSEWLATKKYFNYLGSVLIVIIAAAILANIGLLPSSAAQAPVYSGIFTYAAPIGIFFLMLDVKLKDIRQAGLPMLSMFFVGAGTSIIGVFAGYYLVPLGIVSKSYAVAGMFTGTYIGGSANLNAVALHYGVNNDAVAFAAINAADNIITTLWTILLIVLPAILQRYFPRKIAAATEQTKVVAPDNDEAAVTVKNLAILLLLGVASLLLSQYLSTLFQNKIPGILILTTIALTLAQIPFVQKLKAGKILGYFMILLFLAVIGAYCDLGALSHSGALAFTLFSWIIILVLIHGVLLFLIGAFFKVDWYILAIASLANIGGPGSAAAVASSMNRSDLRVPAVLVGSIGAAIGTYLGIIVAEILK